MKSISKQDISGAAQGARLVEEDRAALSSIEEILEDVRQGKPVIIVDDENRENEGDFIVAAEKATPEVINIMARDGRGLICLPMERAMIERLGLELMGRGNNSRHKTAFTASIEAQEGVTTGISAADRAQTIRTAIDPKSGPQDIATPGHVFPLLARDGGVLVRAGHTEAAVDLAKLAGFSGAGVLCEIMNDDGTMARLPDLVAFAQRHGYKVGTIADLIAYRRRTESLVKSVYQGPFQSAYGGDFILHLYVNTLQHAEHIALVKGDITASDTPILVRMHAVDILGDMLGEKATPALQRSMEMIAEHGRGVIVILREPDPYALSTRLEGKRKKRSSSGSDTDHQVGNAPVLRDYGIGAQILLDLGVRNMILLSDHPKNVVGLDGYGLYIAGYESLAPQED
ncbi:MAG: 3,4-dihydroxy-2-butanone-4-phosphate synthase [Alphaproteobacteria bacterium]|nr:3,4-dihydroxy-2-butanone-4-phosphate synthase [Alphaproteobacteria bacterium]